jgi:prolyl oligopeptidase
MCKSRHIDLVGAALLAVVAACMPSCGDSDRAGARNAKGYPITPKVEQVDQYHGTMVEDPYRWLENRRDFDPEVGKWVSKQNKFTEEFLASVPEREAIRARLMRIVDFPRTSIPWKKGSREFFYENDGLQNHFVLSVKDSPGAPPRALLDPNAWSKDGTVALAEMAFSDSGKLLAFAKSEGGSDWRTWQVMDVETGRPLPDEIRWAFGEASWSANEDGLYYFGVADWQMYDRSQWSSQGSQVRYHRIGSPQVSDDVIYSSPEHPDRTFSKLTMADGRYLVITVTKFAVYDVNQLVIVDLADRAAKPLEIGGDFANEWSVVGTTGTTLYVKTDFDAPRHRVVAFDLREGLASLREVVPQQDEAIHGVALAGDFMLAQYLKDVRPLLRVHRTDGSFVREAQPPGIGAIDGLGTRGPDGELLYTFTSFNQPGAYYTLDPATGESKLFRKSASDWDPSRYTVEQVFYESTDGVRIPMFITTRAGAPRDGSLPTLLYGYGGFNLSIRPWFAPDFALWLELGGAVAVANLRGGGEYGPEWHDAGKRLRKQKTIDDFIAAAEYLVAEKWTNPSRLAIKGESNGGLLVGAAMTQRPELFAAAIPGTGVHDMLRIGPLWVDEYGSLENPEEFSARYAYSPYHRIRPGVKYPATMVMASDPDEVVPPSCSYKFAARLQECHVGDAPVLIRVESSVGHGARVPMSKYIDATTDVVAFLVKALKVGVNEPLPLADAPVGSRPAG